MSETRITIYDTTLRDGAQTVGISFSLQDKIRISRELDKLRIDYIEGGWPGSNPKDDEFFSEIRKIGLSHSRIVAFGSTKHPHAAFDEDDLLRSLVHSGANTLTIVAKIWDFHVRRALGIELKENLELIYGTVAFLKDKGFEVFLDAEHFYDGFKANKEYSLQALTRAQEGGADMLVLCDTNGSTLPDEAADITRAVHGTLKTPLGVHFHNDSGVAVANSLAALDAGAVSVQGTINGYGERCGNCNLNTLLPNLVLKKGLPCAAAEALVHLTEVSRCVSEIANMAHNEMEPYVGENAFAHKGGIHASAIKKDTKTYEHIDPELVGNRRKILVSELSGKSNIEMKAREMGIDLREHVRLPASILKRIKDLEEKGYQFEAAEGSFELIIRQATGEYAPFFNLKGYRVITEKDEDHITSCEATIKVEVGGRIEHTAANGMGPVEALDSALRKALLKFYPDLNELQLTDYKVRVLNEKDGTASSVRVLIDQKRHADHWGTVGVSTNIIEASWQALVDGIEYMLFKKERTKGDGASNE